MSREIRRVPKDWEHPKKRNGSFQPMYDDDFATEAEKWISNFLLWQKGEHPEQDPNYKYYWEIDTPPDPLYYHSFSSDPTHYQIYETVSEGTPVSPVFETEDQIYEWLIGRGVSEKAARNFVRDKWCISGMFSPETGFVSGMNFETAAFHQPKEQQP